MARRLTLPLGQVDPREIESALQKGFDRLSVALTERFGAEHEVRAKCLLVQHEITSRASGAELKNFQKEIGIRSSFSRGAKLVFSWSRRRPGEVSLRIGTTSELEDHVFHGLFAAAAVLTLGAFLCDLVPGGRVVVFFYFLSFLAVLSIPYFAFRAMMRARNRAALDRIESVVREKIDG